ncbi:hypothetical protein HJC23_007119 [Cyclotella cryptica]|uniref:Histone deacetylase domain-containing protein n=1 Tax=Cyclotella cryptica TaxID=29204 RepID=A0ABD3P098_9STRA
MLRRKDPLGVDGSDTFLTTESYNVGVRATGPWIRAVNSALGKDIDVCDAEARDTPTASDKPIGVALTRPPGHHAMYSVANGFCFFKFAMAAAYHAIRQHRNQHMALRLSRDIYKVSFHFNVIRMGVILSLFLLDMMLWIVMN